MIFVCLVPRFACRFYLLVFLSNLFDNDAPTTWERKFFLM